MGTVILEDPDGGFYVACEGWRSLTVKTRKRAEEIMLYVNVWGTGAYDADHI